MRIFFIFYFFGYMDNNAKTSYVILIKWHTNTIKVVIVLRYFAIITYVMTFFGTPYITKSPFMPG